MKIKVPSNTTFGEKLRKIRREKGYTQTQLAEILNTSQRMIAHYESHIKMPPIERVKKIAEALGVSSDDLLGIPPPSKEINKKDEISFKIMKRVKVIEKLPKREQDMIYSMINTFAEKHGIK